MSIGSAFEYDEADESSDEMFQAADEADESIDEADEAADEMYAAADEADESIDEAADESIDESADESVDEEEAMSLSARLRANQAMSSRAAFARKVAADQRADAQRASATRRDLSNRLRTIQSGRARVYTAARLQGVGVVTAMLPNGRRTQMRIIPTMAPVSEVNQLRTVLNVNEKRQAAATLANSRAINSLGAAQAAVVKKLTAQQVISDRELGKRIVEVNQRLDKRISGELTGQKSAVEQNNKKIMRAFKKQRQRQLWNSILLASAAPLYAAYGDRNNPFSKNNLILTGSLLGFLVADEVVDRFTKGSKPGIASGGASFISYSAPFANAGLMYWYNKDKIHERFKAGLGTVTAGKALDVPITIPKDSQKDFKPAERAVIATFMHMTPPATKPATVTPPSLQTELIVNADGNATLRITLLGDAATADVAWAVEMQPQVS